MKTIVLKVDVDTFRGTREGAPRLVELFNKHQVPATFLWSVGPDHTGWALRRIFRPGFFKKVQRTSVVSHYGIKTLLYGVLLPAPWMKKLAPLMQKIAQNPLFEMGIHSYDHVYWQDNVSHRGREWTLRQMDLAQQEFKNIFGLASQTHGAAGWQMNDFAFEWLEQFKYASDGRGTHPFFPRLSSGKTLSCLQMPTTLPTMDELLGIDNTDESNIDQKLLALTQQETPWGHVFTLHAELEGQKLLPAFERFIIGLKTQRYQFFTMKSYAEELLKNHRSSIGVSNVVYGEIPGRSGVLCLQDN